MRSYRRSLRFLNPWLYVLLASFLIFGGGILFAAKPVVKLGTLKLVGSAPIFIALEKGYFDEEGLDVKVEWFTAAAPVSVAVASGDLDVGATGITATFYNSVASGAKMYLVADRGMERPGYPLNALVVNKALYDSGTIRSLKDLKGKKIGLSTLGSTFHYQIGKLLEQEGMSLKDVELTPLRTMPIMIDAVRKGTVPAVILSPPWGAVAEEEGWGKVLFWVGDKLTNQVVGVFYSEKMRNNRELGVRFMKAYIKALHYYYDACLAKPRGAHYDEVIDIIAKYIGQDRKSIERSLSYIDRDGRLYLPDLIAQQEWYVKNGLCKTVVPLEKFTDMSFVEEAAKQLK
ncbi:MAG TPA: ABC transporter substrate-binding protein [Firmicutes bacterium]|nr:ABC transporter substrate-binding protein [Bacillota bacterium]